MIDDGASSRQTKNMCSQVLRAPVRQNGRLSEGYKSMGFSICPICFHQDPSHWSES